MRNLALLYLIAGVGLWLGSANTVYHIPPFILFFPAALYYMGIQAPSRKFVIKHAFLAGTIGYTLCLYWTATPLMQTGMPAVVAAPAPVALSALQAAYGAVFALFCFQLLKNKSPLFVGSATALMWGAIEMARGTFFSGFPWVSVASAFASWPEAIQPVSLMGAEAYSGLLAGLGCYLTAALVASSRKHMVAAVAGFLFVFSTSYTLWQQPVETSGTARIAMVQGNIDQSAKWNRAYQQGTVNRYITLSEQVLKKPVDLVIWPETSMPFFMQQSKEFLPYLRRLAVNSNAAYLIGTPGFGPGTNGREWDVYNRAYLIESDGVMRKWYDKVHLVPFGEYIPFDLDISYFGDLLSGSGTFRPGKTYAPITVDNLALGVLICYETIFTELAQQRVSDGANVLINISNDAWFGDTSAPKQHLDLAVLRAVEQERFIARATNTGISAIIDPKGNIITHGKSFRADVVFGTVNTNENRTVYHHLFSIIRWILMLGGAALLGYSFFTYKKND